MIYRGRSEREGDRTGLLPGKSPLPSLLECSPGQAGEGRLSPPKPLPCRHAGGAPAWDPAGAELRGSGA